LEVKEVHDTLADETSLASKIPKLVQLSQMWLRMDRSISALEQGLRETRQDNREVHEIANDKKKGLFALSELSERINQLENDVGNLVTPPVFWQHELKTQFEVELEDIRASCREAREAAESQGKAFSSDIDALVKTNAQSWQDIQLLNEKTEELKAEVEQVASKVDQLSLAEAKDMRQAVQTDDKIFDALLQEICEKRQLVAGETARANMEGGVVGGGSGALAAEVLKGTDHGSRPSRELIEVKVEKRSTSTQMLAAQVSPQPFKTALQPTGSRIHTAPPSSRQPPLRQPTVPPQGQGDKWQFSCH